MALTLHGTVSDNTVALDRKTATPLIINGDMAIAQRGTSETGITGSTYHTVDRFKTLISSLGTWTLSQSTDVPTGQGFSNSLKWDCTTADASPSAGNYLAHQHKIEGQNLQMLKKGTSSAESFTYSFWVKSNKTGTYNVEVIDKDNSRLIVKQYTISSADTWEKKVLSFAGDTTGTLDNDNAVSLEINMWLGSGSNFSSGTAQTSWGSQTNANRAVGNVNLADSTSNEWYITGVQLEVGTFDSNSIPPFQFEDRVTSLVRCQRYYTQFDYADGNRFAECIFRSTTRGQGNVSQSLPIMRATPSVSSSIPAYQFYYGSDTTNTCTATSGSGFQVVDNFEIRADFTLSSGSSTAGYPVKLRVNGAGALKFDSEL